MKTDKIESLRYRGFDSDRRAHVYVAVGFDPAGGDYPVGKAEIALGKDGYIEAVLHQAVETFDTLPLAENFALKVDLNKL